MKDEPTTGYMKSLLIIIAAIGLAGCSSESSALEKWEGEEVSVQFRRDFLGSGSTAISPTTDTINGAMLSLRGKMTEASREGIFLNARYQVNAGSGPFQEKEVWIPAESILMVEKEK